MLKKLMKKNKLGLKEKTKDLVNEDRESRVKIKEEKNGFSNGENKKK